jgi:type I restriction enzyme R subunit
MEHAIRKHCTVHFDEDPAFYRRLSEKLEQLIQKHKENWDLLSEELSHLRIEAIAGRQDAVAGLDREATTFYEYVGDLAFGNGGVPQHHAAAMKKLVSRVVEILQDTIGIIDFWSNLSEQRRLRGVLTDALLMADIPEVTLSSERLAVEIMKLAKSRHDDLLGARKQ